MTSILYKEESYNIIGAAMEVHGVVGNGFTEPDYQDTWNTHPFRTQSIAIRTDSLHYQMGTKPL